MEPYKRPFLNILEGFSLVTLYLSNLAAAIAFGTDDDNRGFQELSGLIFFFGQLLLGITYAYAMYAIIIAIQTKLAMATAGASSLPAVIAKLCGILFGAV
eukprot:5419622-Prymnesium_polylepis.1